MKSGSNQVFDQLFPPMDLDSLMRDSLLGVVPKESPEREIIQAPKSSHADLNSLMRDSLLDLTPEQGMNSMGSVTPLVTSEKTPEQVVQDVSLSANSFLLEIDLPSEQELLERARRIQEEAERQRKLKAAQQESDVPVIDMSLIDRGKTPEELERIRLAEEQRRLEKKQKAEAIRLEEERIQQEKEKIEKKYGHAMKVFTTDPEIRRFFEPVSRRLFDEKSPRFPRFISFFLGAEAPKCTEDTFLQYDPETDPGFYQHGHHGIDKKEKLSLEDKKYMVARYGCILKYLTCEFWGEIVEGSEGSSIEKFIRKIDKEFIGKFSRDSRFLHLQVDQGSLKRIIDNERSYDYLEGDVDLRNAIASISERLRDFCRNTTIEIQKEYMRIAKERDLALAKEIEKNINEIEEFFNKNNPLWFHLPTEMFNPEPQVVDPEKGIQKYREWLKRKREERGFCNDSTLPTQIM